MVEVGLVLGGGGARGYAHIGVLKALEEREVAPVAIAACSMGAIVGALHGAGLSADQILARAQAFKLTELLDVGDSEALNRGRRLERTLGRHLPRTFEELEVPLKITACDIQQGVQVVFDAGDLRGAVRASIALPGVFPPARVADRILLDGGLVNNLPVDIIRAMTHRPVIAVDVASPPDRQLEFEDDSSWWSTLAHRAYRRPLILEIVMKAYDIPQRLLTDARVALNPPDIFVRPPIDPAIKVEDFDEWRQPFEAGYEATHVALEEFGERIGL
ncbi:MAG TPA: patatin-like phospholipase family protein [Candidatus Krumholzibacteria bacterium]|nr:patatin-like phospholipase family protein [Candidatus Krumholzibacteria bacterium]HPD73169.1 patatin-like phospholipase family protein [Candidatus Krumholzibacteria bacterium]HRY41953.1 patatin-like phospholipase family protein [Candidatus Krumholzibacteria bacterium]